MIEALRAGRLGAAVLDIAAGRAPAPRTLPLWDLDNVLVCPRSASTFATENATLVELLPRKPPTVPLQHPMRNRYRADRGY